MVASASDSTPSFVKVTLMSLLPLDDGQAQDYRSLGRLAVGGPEVDDEPIAIEVTRVHLEQAGFTLLEVLIAIVIKTFIVQAFFIPSGSMIPTLRVGDRVLVEKVSYRLRDPERGDVA